MVATKQFREPKQGHIRYKNKEEVGAVNFERVSYFINLFIYLSARLFIYLFIYFYRK